METDPRQSGFLYYATLVPVILFVSGLIGIAAGLTGVIPLNGRVGVWIGVLVVPFLLWVLVWEVRWGILVVFALIVGILLARWKL